MIVLRLLVWLVMSAVLLVLCGLMAFAGWQGLAVSANSDNWPLALLFTAVFFVALMLTAFGFKACLEDT